jgi:hypothetical protein
METLFSVFKYFIDLMVKDCFDIFQFEFGVVCLHSSLSLTLKVGSVNSILQTILLTLILH